MTKPFKSIILPGETAAEAILAVDFSQLEARLIAWNLAQTAFVLKYNPTDSALHKYRCKIRDKELRASGPPFEEKDLDPDNPDGDPKLKKLAQAVRNLGSYISAQPCGTMGNGRLIKLYGEKK